MVLNRAESISGGEGEGHGVNWSSLDCGADKCMALKRAESISSSNPFMIFLKFPNLKL